MASEVDRLFLLLANVQAELRPGGASFLEAYGREHPDQSQDAMDLLVRLVLRHADPALARSVFEAVRERLATKAQRIHAAALDALQGRPVSDSDHALLDQESREDWVWHLPLAETAWNRGLREAAFVHLERFIHLATELGQDGGWAYAHAESRLLGERACEVCGESSVARTFVPSESFRRTLVVCGSCRGLSKTEVLEDWIRTGRVEKSNPALARLAKLRNPFLFQGGWSWPESWMRVKRPLNSKLRYHRLEVLERRLDRTCRHILGRARAMAAKRGFSEANHLALLAAAAEHKGVTEEASSGLDSLLAAGRAAEAGIEAAGPEDLAQVLNIASWSAIMNDAVRTISLPTLLQALALDGSSSALLMEMAPGLVFLWTLRIPLYMTPDHRATLVALAARFPANRFLQISLHVRHAGLCSVDDYLWFLRNERNCHLPALIFTRGQEAPWADVVTSWTEVLSHDRSLLTLANARSFFDLHHPEIGQSLGLIGYETFRDPLFLGAFPSAGGLSNSRRRRLAARVLECLEELLDQDRHPSDQQAHLDQAVSIAARAGLPSEVKRLGRRYLAGTRNKWSDWHVLFQLAGLAAREGDLVLSARYLREVEPFVPRYDLLVQAAVPIWVAGCRKEFHELLAHFKTHPGAQVEYLDKMGRIYRELEEKWSLEDVQAISSLRLDCPS